MPMSDPVRNLHTVLMDRLQITQDIAAANVEHLRLNQKASGIMVLDMKDEEDGTSDAERDAERLENLRALEVNMDKINDLEAKLSAVDKELEALAETDEE